MATALLHNRVIKSDVKATEILNDNKWDTISKIASAGQAQNYWAVGDTKEIIINGPVDTRVTFDNLAIWAYIIGFDHNSAVEGTGRIHFQIGKTAQNDGESVCLCDNAYGSNYMTSGFTMNNGATTSGGWEACKMRKTLLGNDSTPDSPSAGSLLAALPSDLRKALKACTKYTKNNGVTATEDYLWLLSEFEVFGSRSYANSGEKNYQAQYDYYANGNSKVKYGHNATSTKRDWFLRSPHDTNTLCFCIANSSGSKYFNRADGSRGVAPAFCV